jgi:hypothetical protein
MATGRIAARFPSFRVLPSAIGKNGAFGRFLRPNTMLDWINCNPGYLAKTEAGFYMVYESVDLMGAPIWMAKFEAISQRVNLGGFDYLSDARQSCALHAAHFHTLEFYQAGASILGNQGMGLIPTEFWLSFRILVTFRRLLRDTTWKK